MAAAAALVANVLEMTQKCHREDLPIYDHSYGFGDEEDRNPRKRSCGGFLLKFICFDDDEGLPTVQDELVLDMMKDFVQEISRSSEISITNGYNQIERNSKSPDKEYEGEVEESVGSTCSYEYLVSATDEELGIPPCPTVGLPSSYEYLVSATDDELGIPPCPPVPVDENGGPNISQKFWSDLFENSSTESFPTAENVGTLQPCLSYCYSSNYRD